MSNFIEKIFKKRLVSKNMQYVVVLIAIFLFLGVFFSSRAWMDDERENKTSNYDMTIKLTNGYSIKLNNAIYDPATNILTVDWYAKEMTANYSEKPYIDKITLGDSTGERLSYKLVELESNPSYGKRIIIYNVPDKWYYIRIYVNCKNKDTQLDAHLDEFGNIVIPDVKEGKLSSTYTCVDNRTAQWRDIIDRYNVFNPFIVNDYSDYCKYVEMPDKVPVILFEMPIHSITSYDDYTMYIEQCSYLAEEKRDDAFKAAAIISADVSAQPINTYEDYLEYVTAISQPEGDEETVVAE